MGGTPKRLLDRFDNLLRVCARLNYAMESDVTVARFAKEMGYKLKQSDDFSLPYYDHILQKWIELSFDGTKRVL